MCWRWRTRAFSARAAPTRHLRAGLNVCGGQVTHAAVAALGARLPAGRKRCSAEPGPCTMSLPATASQEALYQRCDPATLGIVNSLELPDLDTHFDSRPRGRAIQLGLDVPATTATTSMCWASRAAAATPSSAVARRQSATRGLRRPTGATSTTSPTRPSPQLLRCPAAVVPGCATTCSISSRGTRPRSARCSRATNTAAASRRCRKRRNSATSSPRCRRWATSRCNMASRCSRRRTASPSFRSRRDKSHAVAGRVREAAARAPGRARRAHQGAA